MQSSAISVSNSIGFDDPNTIPPLLRQSWSHKYDAEKSIVDVLSPAEQQSLILHATRVSTMANSAGSFSDIVNATSELVRGLIRKNTLTNSFLRVILHLINSLPETGVNLKYKSMEDFLEKYPEMSVRDERERQRLLQTANWMHILFQIIPAKKNKGVALDVVPKFVEGYGATYITGSGQTRPTCDRVKIYECEGNVLPAKRYKWKAKKTNKQKRPYRKKTVAKHQQHSPLKIERKQRDQAYRKLIPDDFIFASAAIV